MRCPTCGHENTDTARLCRDCGTSLFMNCPSCGHENTAGSTFCAGCGEQLREASPGGVGAGGDPAIYEVSRPAGFWIRFLASIIDGIPLTLVSALLARLLFGENLFDAFAIESDETGAGGFTAGQGLNVLLSGIYATALVSMLGGTLGVLLLKMHILRPDGAMLGPGRALARYIVITLSFLLLVPIIVSAFMVGLRRDRRGIHDLVCDTVVVISGRSPRSP